jgi:hypothetical protein
MLGIETTRFLALQGDTLYYYDVTPIKCRTPQLPNSSVTVP